MQIAALMTAALLASLCAAVLARPQPQRIALPARR